MDLRTKNKAVKQRRENVKKKNFNTLYNFISIYIPW